MERIYARHMVMERDRDVSTCKLTVVRVSGLVNMRDEGPLTLAP